MNLKLEAIIIPVSDVDRAKKFYQEALGFRVDVDHRAAVYKEALGFRRSGEASYRIVQRSRCERAVPLRTGRTDTRPRS